MRRFAHSATTTVVPNDLSPWTGWRLTGLVIGITSLCVVGLFWETVRSMIDVWASSRTFAHGFLVLPATGFLIWCYRHKWAQLEPAPSPWGVAALVLLGGGWFVGYVTEMIWLQQAAVVAMLPGLIWAILGKEIVKTLAWPLGFLVFMLPVGTSIEPALQDFTAWFIQVGLQVTHIPYLYEEDYRIVISSGTWKVDVDCAGLRYLLPGLASGYAFATLIYRQPARRLVFLALCAVVLMVANGIRAYSVIVGDHFGIADGTDHRVFSYTIYGATLPLLFWLGLRWGENMTVTSSQRPTPDVRCGLDTRRTILMAIAAVAVLALAPLSVWLWAGLR
ncbi:MAG: exosortase A [Nitrospirota bacterium]